MSIVDRFISYTQIDTTSYDGRDVCPSNPNELILASQLCQELKELGIEDARIDGNGFVYGTLASNVDWDCYSIGLVAHMDTSNATSGANIKPRIIENYDGKDIELSEGIYSTVEDYPILSSYQGKSIIVTDGTTLLGADDKAGIAIIMQYLENCHNNPEIRHGRVVVCFTPDEEIGTGILKFDLNEFNVDFPYTLDGGQANGLAYECFNAASAIITFNGNSIHPGTAKGTMINACQLAIDFHNRLPVFDRPEFTEGREGFNHLLGMKGDCQSAQSYYIIRNHDSGLFHKQMRQFEMIAEQMNFNYGKNVVDLQLQEGYHNMRECFTGKEYIIEFIHQANKEDGLDLEEEAIRGGTGGAEHSIIGNPTPNIGTGGVNCHGNHEFVCIEDMKIMVDVVEKILSKAIERK